MEIRKGRFTCTGSKIVARFANGSPVFGVTGQMVSDDPTLSSRECFGVNQFRTSVEPGGIYDVAVTAHPRFVIIEAARLPA